jgi:hypothetical protein
MELQITGHDSSASQFIESGIWVEVDFNYLSSKASLSVSEINGIYEPPPPEVIPEAAPPVKKIPLPFDMSKILLVKDLIKIFEVGTRTDLPAYEWTTNERKKIKFSSRYNDNYSNLCKIYIYVHKNIDSLPPDKDLEKQKWRNIADNNEDEKPPAPTLGKDNITKAINLFNLRKLSEKVDSNGGLIYT